MKMNLLVQLKATKMNDMAKKAMLVTFTFEHRVIVDEIEGRDINTDAIIAACEKHRDYVTMNSIGDNVDEIIEDETEPFGTFETDNDE